ncbi:MAG: hypothetical protein H6636_09750 [Anaerolineales bacterium]|nr:hypothetical protein [Anaerolineales bacterium]
MDSSRNRNLIFAILGVLVFCCIGLIALSVAGVALFRISGETTSPIIPSINDSSSTTSDGEIAPDVIRQMETIEQQVIQLRGLQPSGSFDRALFTPEQLREHVLNDFNKDYTPEDAQKDAQILAAFGLVRPDFDFYNFYIDLLSEQIAGFYDNETKEMVVVQGEAFAGPERLTYAHEYTHALQDENYDIKNGLGYDDVPCEEDSERCAAIQALLEGDATLSEIQWFSQFSTNKDKQQLQDFYSNLESPVYDSAPAFMQDDFIFPYDQGYEFVNTLFENGGYAAVDDAYRNLPVSTEQILHPEKYPDDHPIAVALPDLLPTLGEGWTLLDQNVMGEWYTYLILARGLELATHIGDQNSADAAAGWGGDSYAVYLSPAGDTTALVLSTVWDTANEATEFAAAFEQYATARFGPPTADHTWEENGIVTLFTLNGDHTIWVSAPSLATAQAILTAVQP